MRIVCCCKRFSLQDNVLVCDTIYLECCFEKKNKTTFQPSILHKLALNDVICLKWVIVEKIHRKKQIITWWNCCGRFDTPPSSDGQCSFIFWKIKKYRKFFSAASSSWMATWSKFKFCWISKKICESTETKKNSRRLDMFGIPLQQQNTLYISSEICYISTTLYSQTNI